MSQLEVQFKTAASEVNAFSNQIISSKHDKALTEYANSPSKAPLLMHGDALEILKTFPCASVDCVMTSPPYWGKREYSDGGIGLEKDYKVFIENLCEVFFELKRVLKDEGSFWLNIGDSYKSKRLLGIPWRVAIELIDEQGWILRNNIIWNKVKSGMDNTKDRLGNVHEDVFHFVKQKKYFYDTNAIRSKPREAKVINGAVVSATGVSGVRYKRQIELSTALNEQEKKNALHALNLKLSEISEGKISDFRMIIRGQQRTTHSNSKKISGRAKELHNKGFYFLRYHPKGSKPTDVWDILPEDTQKRKVHFSPYPEDLCRLPILATCPQQGIVLDPFCGTGTTLLVAKQLNRKSVGIDISQEYLELASERVWSLI